MVKSDNAYTAMQLREYTRMAADWSESYRNPVVGSFDAHNRWADYEHLFTRLEDQSNKIGLDFGCGPGRNIVKYKSRFRRLDGVDLCEINLKNAKNYAANNGANPPILYLNNGIDLAQVPTETYDFVMSTICLQHICVHEIRQNLFAEFYRVLVPNGLFTAQMGFGVPSIDTVDYYANHYEAKQTNRACDTSIEKPEQLEKDLLAVGFVDFQFNITPVGPGDKHPNWIFFSVRKDPPRAELG